MPKSSLILINNFILLVANLQNFISILMQTKLLKKKMLMMSLINVKTSQLQLHRQINIIFLKNVNNINFLS